MKIFRILRYPFMLPIMFYRKFISPLFPARCKYYPTCSSYCLQAYSRHGVIKGSILSGWRLLRCNPWSLGGVDKVPEKLSYKDIVTGNLRKNKNSTAPDSEITGVRKSKE